MIPKTGPISIEDFKKTHGCYAPMGNPEFGGVSSSTAPFELSNVYTKEMIPYSRQDYVGDQQDMNDKRGCVASLNRENWGTSESNWSYPGRTFVYYGNTSGLTSISYAVVSDGASGTNYGDPWGTNIRSLIRGKASSGLPSGLNSTVSFNMHFYMEEPQIVRVKFRHRFTFSGTGPANDPHQSPERQGTFLLGVEYADIWNGSNSRVVYNQRLLTNSNGNSADQIRDVPFTSADSGSYPYKLLSFQMNNHGHPTTDSQDLFRAYWGNFAFEVR